MQSVCKEPCLRSQQLSQPLYTLKRPICARFLTMTEKSSCCCWLSSDSCSCLLGWLATISATAVAPWLNPSRPCTGACSRMAASINGLDVSSQPVRKPTHESDRHQHAKQILWILVCITQSRSLYHPEVATSRELQSAAKQQTALAVSRRHASWLLTGRPELAASRSDRLERTALDGSL